MRSLREGALRFAREIHPQRQYGRLASGQSPHTMFITCSDSRICPSLLTGSEPGDIFVLRNAGNFVPSWSEAHGTGEAGTIEFALRGLGVKDIVICGHSQCGAVKAALAPAAPANMPALATWIRHARVVAGDDVQRAVEANVLAQLAHLRTHPAVQEALEAGTVQVHGWTYDLATGTVCEYDPAQDRFVPVQDLVPMEVPA